jgi:phenylpropionate dioxygenase-like ring-hydroxylating dioxygenase large terminal subunit
VDVVGLTTTTPIDADTTQVTQVFYWPWWLGILKPFFWAFGRTFLSDDRKMVELQREGLKFNPSLMLIQDSDVPAMWYHRLKKAWAESTATGAPFVNPVKERTLKWRS